jgi:hypothetical protein
MATKTVLMMALMSLLICSALITEHFEARAKKAIHP